MSKSSKKKSSVAVEDADSNSQDIFICQISHNRRVAVRNFKGKTLVDIRECYFKDGKKRPGKKGMSLTKDQWKILRAHINEIDEALAENN